MQLFRHISELVSMAGAAQKQGRRIQEVDLGLVPRAAILVNKGKIVWQGDDQKIPKEWARKKLKEKSLKGFTVLPGFIESHTHTVFAGSRATEFEMRNQGISYQEISAQGGGIHSTVRATRAATFAELTRLGQERVDKFLREGVSTLEIKSGYGLNLKDEIKILQVSAKLRGPRLITTFLGAHAKPPEFDSTEKYLEFLAHEVLPIVKKRKLANRVDIFIENGFFQKEPGKKFLKIAVDLGFQLTIHADQMSLSGGSEVALELKALSADHLIEIGPEQINKLSKSEVTCVLLPAADFYMKCRYPPARELIDAGARVALATDFNPGTSPTQDLSFVGFLARSEMKMTLPEVLSAYTIGAAYALNMQANLGSLEAGKSADFSCTKKSWRDLFYSIGSPNIDLLYIDGKIAINNT